MSPASKSQQKAVAKYMKNNYDELKVRLPKGSKDEIQTHAAAKGESLNGYVSKAIDERIERDRATASDLKGANDDAGI